MNLIFLDFEMTCWSNQDRLEAPCREIIQIGAVKLNEKHELVDRFIMNVKPIYVKDISTKCTKLTGLVWKDLEDAVSFPEALDHFTEWMGENPRIFAWGPDDKLQFNTECKTKEIEESRLKSYERWTDLQAVFNGICGLKRRMSLMNALYIVGYDFEGKQHDAGDDAYNTSRLAKHIFYAEGRQKLRKSFGLEEEESQGSTIGDILGKKLKGLNLED